MKEYNKKTYLILKIMLIISGLVILIHNLFPFKFEYISAILVGIIFALALAIHLKTKKKNHKRKIVKN